MMNKLKRTNSTGFSTVNKSSKRNLSQLKNSNLRGVKPKAKKLFQDFVEKENILIEEPQPIKYGLKNQGNKKKKVSEKKNKRSKSMIYDKKVLMKIDTTQNSSRFV